MCWSRWFAMDQDNILLDSRIRINGRGLWAKKSPTGSRVDGAGEALVSIVNATIRR